MLKNLFLQQQQRLEAMLELEDKMRVRFPDGCKRNTLYEIAAEIEKLEIGEQWMPANFRNMPYVIAGYGELSDLAKGMAEFDAVDRNLIYEAATRFVDMIQKGEVDSVKAILSMRKRHRGKERNRTDDTVSNRP
jgi:hypothetical protein